MKFKTFTIASLLLLSLFLSGCKTIFQNYTPERITQNPSGIYTFSFTADPATTNWIEGTASAEIVINGETFPMEKSEEGEMTFSFDYKMPEEVNQARYYYILRYDYSNNGSRKTAVKYSVNESGRMYQSRLINRYTIQLVSERGPVGSRIGLVGNGFTSQDVVVIGGMEADTEVFSANSLEFTVPALPAGKEYKAFLRTGGGDLPIGNFRVDSARLRVQPTELVLTTGMSDFLIFEIESEAPASGLPIKVLTDIPDSIIMPEIAIPAGARSVNVTVEGGEPGQGRLVVEVPGYDPITVPVTVNP